MTRSAHHTLQVGGMLDLRKEIELTFEHRGRTGGCCTLLEDISPDYPLIPREYRTFTERQRTLPLNFIITQQVALKRRGLL